KIHWNAGVYCSTLTSVASSSWSLTSTWSPSQAPTSCNPVVIAAGTAVTVDVVPAISTVAINAGGTLDLNGFNMTLSSFTNSGNFRLQGAESVSSAPKNLIGSTVTYTATSGTPLVFSTWTYQILQINGPGSAF